MPAERSPRGTRDTDAPVPLVAPLLSPVPPAPLPSVRDARRRAAGGVANVGGVLAPEAVTGPPVGDGPGGSTSSELPVRDPAALAATGSTDVLGDTDAGMLAPVVRRRKPRRGSATAWRTREALVAHCETQCPVREADGRPEWLDPETHDELEAARVFLTRVDLAARYDAAWDEYLAQRAGLAAAVQKCRVYAMALETGAETLDDGSLASLKRDLHTAELSRDRKAAAPWSSVRALRTILMEHRLRDACAMAAKRWRRRRTELLAELESVDTYLLEAGSATAGFAMFGLAQALVHSPTLISAGGVIPVVLGLIAAAWTYRPRAVARGRRITELHAQIAEVEAYEASCAQAMHGGGVPTDGALNDHEQRLVIGSEHQRGSLASLGAARAGSGYDRADTIVANPVPQPPTPQLAEVAARWARSTE